MQTFDVMYLPTPMYIFGAGGHGHDILAIVNDISYYQCVGFFDDDKSKWPLADCENNFTYRGFGPKFVAIGLNWPYQRFKMFSQMIGWEFATIVHPTVSSMGQTLGDGVIVGQHTSLGYNSEIGRHTHIGAGVVIHRGKIGEFVTVCPGATICGDVTIGDFVTVGAGATISNLVTIGEGAFIGAGAVVVNDVEPYTTVAGVPAKEINVHNSLQV
jgi:sugar O-acyltransferase (sialic acid O-acetyltransferase NeuD family)